MPPQAFGPSFGANLKQFLDGNLHEYRPHNHYKYMLLSHRCIHAASIC
jgi:hypothetical protein